MRKSNQKKEIEKLKCVECVTEKPKDKNFYNTNNKLYQNIGKIPVCKDCLKASVDVNNMKTVFDLLKQFDIKFDITYWNKALESKYETFGRYFSMANSLPQFENAGWSDSIFELNEKTEENASVKSNTKNSRNQKIQVTDDIIAKWGDGYSDEEYASFERKYLLLRNNYQEKTAMHTEALLTYVRYRVKEELATAKGSVKEAKDWGAMAKEAATAAKINPSQLSKSDLSDGLDTFGQLVRSVEQAVDIIPILPKFKERPQDKVDFTLLCYINYIRDLKGLPLAEYEDVYKFYEDRKKEYEDRSGSLDGEE